MSTLLHVDPDLLARRDASVEARADALIDWLARGATRSYIGEDVSQLEHALQAAACARAGHGGDDLVLASLLHDLGHIIAPDAPSMDGFGTIGHEHICADLLRAFGFSEAVAAPIAQHVEAKRYLCARRSGYLARLSNGSRETLARQGGPMTGEEADAFGARADLRAILAVRAWDEAGKVPGLSVPGLETHRPLLVEHLSRHPSEHTSC